MKTKNQNQTQEEKMKKLNGTEKQVAWAEKIRERYSKTFVEDLEDIKDKEKAKKIYNFIMENVVEAKWWINDSQSSLDSMDILEFLEDGYELSINGKTYNNYEDLGLN